MNGKRRKQRRRTRSAPRRCTSETPSAENTPDRPASRSRERSPAKHRSTPRRRHLAAPRAPTPAGADRRARDRAVRQTPFAAAVDLQHQPLRQNLASITDHRCSPKGRGPTADGSVYRAADLWFPVFQHPAHCARSNHAGRESVPRTRLRVPNCRSVRNCASTSTRRANLFV